MKNILKTLVLFISIATLSSCSSDDDNGAVGPMPTGESKTYQLASVSDPSISGTATFIENTDESVTINLQLSGTPSGGMHPAHIHNGFAEQAVGGPIALDLGTVNGNTGFSTKTVSTLNDGTSISYDQLLDFDGYINVHLSADDLGTLVAQGNIGQNELTGNSTTYALGSVADPTISGTVMFSELVNGDALAKIELDGTPAGGIHPAHIHMGSVATAPGSIIFTFNSVNGDTGVSYTKVAELDDMTSFGYSDVLSVDGYVNVHLSSTDLGTLVAQGNVGANN